MPQSSYQTPVQLGWSTFGSMSAPTGRQSYSGPSDPCPTSDGESRQMYSAAQGPQSLPSQQYASRSPNQSYGMQGAPQSSTTQQSPHTMMKSPHPAAPSSSTPVQSMAHDPYCPSFYAAPHSAHPSSDMDDLESAAARATATVTALLVRPSDPSVQLQQPKPLAAATLSRKEKATCIRAGLTPGGIPSLTKKSRSGSRLRLRP